MLANLKAVAAIGGSIMAAGVILIGVLSCFGNAGMPSHEENHQQQQHATVEVRTGRGAHKSNVSWCQMQPTCSAGSLLSKHLAMMGCALQHPPNSQVILLTAQLAIEPQIQNPSGPHR
jgi:hypothetical protein